MHVSRCHTSYTLLVPDPCLCCSACCLLLLPAVFLDDELPYNTTQEADKTLKFELCLFDFYYQVFTIDVWSQSALRRRTHPVTIYIYFLSFSILLAVDTFDSESLRRPACPISRVVFPPFVSPNPENNYNLTQPNPVESSCSEVFASLFGWVRDLVRYLVLKLCQKIRLYGNL